MQLEELRAVPASSEKAIADATARKEELEKQKVKEEEKLKEVMESLKEETSGLQQDKEVRAYVKSICFYVKPAGFFLSLKLCIWIPSLPNVSSPCRPKKRS